jgi:hypothetical protein
MRLIRDLDVLRRYVVPQEEEFLRMSIPAAVYETIRENRPIDSAKET